MFGPRESHERLDPAVEVAVHHVGAADVDDRVAAVREREDARVLEVAPEMLRTRMDSLKPGTPGRSEQMPRTQTSIGTPAWLAR